jgi:hypothetical protein
LELDVQWSEEYAGDEVGQNLERRGRLPA